MRGTSFAAAEAFEKWRTILAPVPGVVWNLERRGKAYRISASVGLTREYPLGDSWLPGRVFVIAANAVANTATLRELAGKR